MKDGEKKIKKPSAKQRDEFASDIMTVILELQDAKDEAEEFMDFYGDNIKTQLKEIESSLWSLNVEIQSAKLRKKKNYPR